MTRLAARPAAAPRAEPATRSARRASTWSTTTPSSGSGGDHGRFDVAIVDFPDPNNFSLGKLYTTHFYRMLRRALAPGAPVVRAEHLAAHGAQLVLVRRRRRWRPRASSTRAYHVAVPSFGEWGYVLARDAPFERAGAARPAVPLAFLNDAALPTMFVFPERHGAACRWR